MDKIVNVLVFSESRYPVNRRKIKKIVEKFLEGQDIKGPVEVSVAIVGNRKMRSLNKKFRDQDKTTDILSFSLTEGKPSLLPTDGVLRLGDIVISYPAAVANAAREEVMVDLEITELIEHGLSNLLNINNEG